jgi:hypothetical protein
MRERNEADLSARVAALDELDPGTRLRQRVLAAMAGAAEARAGDFRVGGPVAEASFSIVGPAVRRALRPTSRPTSRPPVAPWFAMAAGLAGIAVLFGIFLVSPFAPKADGPGLSEVRSVPAATNSELAASNAEIRTAGGNGAASTDVAPLIEVSWLLERALDELPAQRQLMRAGTATTIAALETQISIIDERLSFDSTATLEPLFQEALWRDRVEVMNALYQVRYAQSQLFNY